MFVGLFLRATVYSLMIKNPDGVPLDFGRAGAVSLVQLVIAAVIMSVGSFEAGSILKT